MTMKKMRSMMQILKRKKTNRMTRRRKVKGKVKGRGTDM
jgi:hypothetical protein